MAERAVRVTIREIARHLNVSHATVSRALNRPQDPLISAATRKRVAEVARELGYRPNHAARALVTGRTGQISLWLWSESVQDSFQANVAHYAHGLIQNKPFELMVNLVGHRTLELAEQRVISPVSVDGIISYEAGPAVRAMFGESYAAYLPLVSVGVYNFLEGVDRVQVDLSEGANAAMAHLIGLGRSRVAYLTDHLFARSGYPARPFSNFDARAMAYEAEVAKAGLKLEYIESMPGRPAARQAMVEYVRRNGAPGAIFCHNDDAALGAYRGLCDLGLRIPEDVAIVGCDGIEDTEYLEKPLSTIVQPLDQVMEIAWSYLEARIADPRVPLQHAVIKPQFVARESSAG